jgi:hypothetical protein
MTDMDSGDITLNYCHEKMDVFIKEPLAVCIKRGQRYLFNPYTFVLEALLNFAVMPR